MSAGKRRWRFRFKPLSISISPRQGVPCLGISCWPEEDEEVKSDAALSGKAARNSFQAVAEVCLETFCHAAAEKKKVDTSGRDKKASIYTHFPKQSWSCFGRSACKELETLHTDSRLFPRQGFPCPGDDDDDAGGDDDDDHDEENDANDDDDDETDDDDDDDADDGDGGGVRGWGRGGPFRVKKHVMSLSSPRNTC